MKKENKNRLKSEHMEAIIYPDYMSSTLHL